VDTGPTDTALIDLTSPGVQVGSTNPPHHPAVSADTGPAHVSVPHRVNGDDASFEDERARLEAEIGAARARTAAATERTRRREAEARQAMRAEVEETRRLIAQLADRHHEALALIEETAELEIARLRAQHEASLRATSAEPDATDGGAAHG
jgi:hypothetical protein